MNGLELALAEIFLAVSAAVLLVFCAGPFEKRVPVVGAAAALVGAVFLVFIGAGGFAFSEMFVVDGFARVSKILILAASLFSLVFGRGEKGEYAVLVLFSALGMMVMASANDLIVLYAGLELQNLALYVLASMRKGDARVGEAGLKYVTLGAASSAILVFGISLLYGAAGSTHFAALADGGGAGFAVGIAFLLAGLAFKMAAAPFHIWAPDVYEGAPMPVTALLLAAPKAAGLVVLVRLLEGPFAQAREVWAPMVIFLAVASIFFGALGGLAQKNLKRLMAYSAIKDMGVMLVGAALAGGAGATDGFSGIMLYLVLYFCGTFGLFAVLLCLEKDGKAVEEIADLSGLMKTQPALAACLGASVFSLAGIPPLAGFFGKYYVLLAAVKGDMIWLALLGVLASVIAAAYYLRVVKVMAFDPPAASLLVRTKDAPLFAAAVLAALAVTLFLVAPAPLMEATHAAAESLMR